MSSPTLSLVVIRASDLERSAKFYRALGFELTREKHGSGPEHYSCNAGAVVLEIYPAGTIGSQSGAGMLGFCVASVPETLDALLNEGVSLISGPTNTERGQRMVVLDPDGNKLELVGANPSLQGRRP